jgi:hypothetical protein
MPANMMANESFVRPAIAGFLSVRRARLPKLGHSTAPSVVLHPHQSPRVPLQSQAYRHHHSINWHSSHLPRHGQPRKRIVRQVRLGLLPLVRHQCHSQSHLHPLLALALALAASLAGETLSSALHNCVRTHYWHRWSPTVSSVRCAASGFSFARTARSVRTHGSNTEANV